MKSIIVILVSMVSFSFCFAQAPQFAVVRPNGTTYICPTIDSAYNKAQNGDFIYLPGGSYGFSFPVNKKISIFGAGCHPDSSQITSKTILNGLTLKSGASEGSITGCYINVYCYSGCPPSINIQGNVTGYSITNCYINSGIQFDSVSSNFIIAENIIGNFGQGCLYGGSFSLKLLGQNHLIASNFISGVVSSYGGNFYSNNIFSYCETWCGTSLSCTNEEFENNIFRCAGSGVSNSIFRNNIGRGNGTDGQNNQGYNNYTINSAIDSLFISYPGHYLNPNFWLGNLHLRPNSPYLQAGTNGTQLGIYGGNYPAPEGWIPRNPHIYFKHVAPQTNNSGQLQIQFGVRTNN